MPIPNSLEAAKAAVEGARRSVGVVSAAAEAPAPALASASAYDANRAYVEQHDHWQNGKEWVGPQGDPVLWAVKKAQVHRQFAPVDAIGEVLERIANALLRREADVSFTPVEAPKEGEELSDPQKDEIGGMQELVSGWWDRVGLWRAAREAVKRSRWAQRGYLRLWIPPGRLEKGEDDKLRPPAGLDVAGALEMIGLAAPDPSSCAIYLDEETQTRYGVFLFEEDEGKTAAEVWHVDGTTGDTVLEVFREGKDQAEEHRYALNGFLPIVEIGGELLITEPVRAQQRQLNYFNSLLTRIMETAGFPERYVVNAQPHGIWLPRPPSEGPALQEKQHGGRTFYLHPSPRLLGASQTTELVGLPKEEHEGGRVKRSFETPAVTFKDPTDPEFAIKSVGHSRGVILRQCKQGHLVEDSTAEASGFAYIQARADFEADLDNTRGPTEGAVREVISCAIAFAEDISGVAEAERFLAKYRTVINLDVDTGPTTPEQQQQDATAVEKGLLSRETAMARNGVEDVPGELSRIEAEPGNQLTILLKRTEVMAQLRLAAPSLPLVHAAIAAGWDEADARKLFAEADAAEAQDRQARSEIEDELARGAGGSPEEGGEG